MTIPVARRKGYRLGFAPKAVIYHKEGRSTGNAALGSRRSLVSEHYLISSRIKLTKKFYPWFLPTVVVFCLAQTLRAAGRGDGARVRVMLRAILGMTFVPGLL